jgi:hypothetical protein
MYRPETSKISERQKLSRRRRRALSATGMVLTFAILASWFSLHAWSRDGFPAWLRAATESPLAALAALLPDWNADAPAKRSVAARSRIAPVDSAASRLAVTRPQDAAADAASVRVADVSAERPTTLADDSVQTEGAVASGPQIGPTDPAGGLPEVPVDVPVGAPGEGIVGGVVGEVVGGLVPEDFQVSLNPSLGTDALGGGANVGLQLDPGDTQASVGLEAGTPVTPVSVDTRVSLTEGNVGAGLGVGASLASAGVDVGTASGVSAGGSVANVAEIGVSIDPASGTTVTIGSLEPLGVEISAETGNPSSGSLLPSIQLGILNNN